MIGFKVAGAKKRREAQELQTRSPDTGGGRGGSLSPKHAQQLQKHQAEQVLQNLSTMASVPSSQVKCKFKRRRRRRSKRKALRGAFHPVTAYRVTREMHGPWAGWADSAALINHVARASHQPSVMCSSYCRCSSGSYDIAHISSSRGLGRVENLHQALQVAQEEKLQKSEPRNGTCGEALSGEPEK
ncbi:hypothetical protein Q8A67_024170 [Cirrhinus molitorella]|uniref:Uncharacterized protein n=1 Tax=Cirrhinus molitorella TaxID=172907 RepID=A0AA88TBI7_9TELE|nr:hypothetical protein Q8A67_024170 [Cirrhinus molitorella]